MHVSTTYPMDKTAFQPAIDPARQQHIPSPSPCTPARMAEYTHAHPQPPVIYWVPEPPTRPINFLHCVQASNSINTIVSYATGVASGCRPPPLTLSHPHTHIPHPPSANQRRGRGPSDPVVPEVLVHRVVSPDLEQHLVHCRGGLQPKLCCPLPPTRALCVCARACVCVHVVIVSASVKLLPVYKCN